MRITNSMVSNRMLLNINRNAGNVDSLYQQWASGKKIQFPSQNPIIASRALKFRTTVAENAQYQKNAEQGASWMSVTEDGYKEVTKILKQISELVTQGDGAENYSDKQAIATQIKSLTEQLGLTMNKSYTGRYLFSGYRTDEPGVLVHTDTDLEYTDITQNFTRSDIEQMSAYQKLGDAKEPTITDCSVIKLAYKDCTNVVVESGTPTGTTTATLKSSKDVDAYTPGDNQIYYLEDTGELVLGKDFQGDSAFKVTYDKKSFDEGELNPKVYFTCTDKDGKTYTMDDQDIKYEFGVGTRFPVNSLGKDVVTDKMYGDLMNFCNSILEAKTSTVADIKASLKALSGNADKTDEELTAMATEQISREQQKIETSMKSRFSNMLTIVEKHASAVSKSQTDLGSRMSRLELIQERLDEDEEAYTKLMSENEDADLYEVAMLLKNAEATYQAAMQVGMSMIQVSLVNFL